MAEINVDHFNRDHELAQHMVSICLNIINQPWCCGKKKTSDVLWRIVIEITGVCQQKNISKIRELAATKNTITPNYKYFWYRAKNNLFQRIQSSPWIEHMPSIARKEMSTLFPVKLISKSTDIDGFPIDVSKTVTHRWMNQFTMLFWIYISWIFMVFASIVNEMY